MVGSTAINRRVVEFVCQQMVDAELESYKRQSRSNFRPQSMKETYFVKTCSVAAASSRLDDILLKDRMSVIKGHCKFVIMHVFHRKLTERLTD